MLTVTPQWPTPCIPPEQPEEVRLSGALQQGRDCAQKFFAAEKRLIGGHDDIINTYAQRGPNHKLVEGEHFVFNRCTDSGAYARRITGTECSSAIVAFKPAGSIVEADASRGL